MPNPTGFRLAGRWFPHAEWEAICRRCGRCCHEKDDHDGTVVFTDIPCRQLQADGRCGCYPDRLEREPDCRRVTPANIAAGTLLPPDCAYVLLYEELLEEMIEHPERGFRTWWRSRRAAR